MSHQLMLRAALDQHVDVLVTNCTGERQWMSTNCAFDPDAVEALAAAFQKSWSFISDDPLLAKKDPKLLQRRLVEYLMQLAADGERNPLRLANGAIGRMRHEHSSKVALHPQIFTSVDWSDSRL